VAKKAIRISLDGSNSDVSESEIAIKKKLDPMLSTLPASVRVHPYEPDNPEALKMEAGKMLKWIAGDEARNGNPVAEPNGQAAEDEKFTHQLKRLAGPALKNLMAEVMWGPGGKEAWKKAQEAKSHGTETANSPA
jgi:hypothetical protein